MSQTATVELGIEGLSSAVYLGAGGSANVFAAHHMESGEQVAVKLLRASADSEQERKRFETEKEALHKLSTRDGIVSLIDSGVTDRKEPYLLMPLMAGSLQDRLDTAGSLEWESAARVMIEVAETVEFAHSQQVLHRDLKPGNILLDSDGVPSVSDFGIAKLMDSSVSMSSKSLGTPSFMPPERFRGEEATPASDVYGLGATLASLITGSAPFLTGENDTDAAVMMRVVSDDPPALEGLGVPDDIANVVTSSMAKDPNDRPASAAEFARRLRDSLSAAGSPPPANPVTVAVPRRNLIIPDVSESSDADDKGTKRNKVAWLVAALLLLMFGTAGALLIANRDEPIEVEVASETDVLDAQNADASNSDEPGTESPASTDDTSDPTDGASNGADSASDTPGIPSDSDDEQDTAAGGEPGESSEQTKEGAPTEDSERTLADSTPEPATPARQERTPDPSPDPVEKPAEVTPTPDPTAGPDPTPDPIEVGATPDPKACFAGSSSSVHTGDSVSFSNCSTDATAYSWTFGDGASSTLAAPSHSWSTAGTYTVRLTARRDGESHSANRTVTVTTAPVVTPDPVACFSASDYSVHTGVSVSFSNCSTDATTYSWTFGDGNPSTHKNPSHSWSTAGTYTVHLTATRGTKTDSTSKTVTVTTAPVADPAACFSASSYSVHIGVSVSFSNCSTDSTDYAWNFDDGATSTHKNPSHSWSHAGTYTVRLTASRGTKSDWTTKTVTVTTVVTAGPDAENRYVTLGPNQDSVSSNLVTGQGTAVGARVLNDNAGGKHYTLKLNGEFSHNRASDDAYSFWIDYELVDAEGRSGAPARIHINAEAKADDAPEDRHRTITMTSTQTQIDVNLLNAGGNSARWIDGEDKHALHGNGRYLYERESNSASTHTFRFYELLNQKLIVRWTVTVNVEAYLALTLAA